MGWRGSGWKWWRCSNCECDYANSNHCHTPDYLLAGDSAGGIGPDVGGVRGGAGGRNPCDRGRGVRWWSPEGFIERNGVNMEKTNEQKAAGPLHADGCRGTITAEQAERCPLCRIRSLAPDCFALLKEILNSDMAARQEDEGRKSPLLKKVRSIIAKAKIKSP
jgi:hypothetical protein